MAKKRGDIIESSGEKDIAADQPAWLKDRLKWLMGLRLGLILHWGPYSQWDCCESWGLVPADTWARQDKFQCWTQRGKDLARFQRDYWKLNETFNPTDFDPDAWAAVAAAAGMKYVAFTTKHHDGFCMFDTRTTDYRVTHPTCPFHTSPRANITREVFDAFRRKGLAISCYFSKSDWHSPYYWSPDAPALDRNPNYDTAERPELWAGFVDFVHRQVEELMTDYGPIDMLWLDGGQVRPPRQDIQMDRLAEMARRRQPGLIIADRTVGGRHENFITPEQTVPDKPLGVPWECCITLGQHWKHFPGDSFKPAGEVIRMLADVAAKGGNLLLGVGPDPAGRFPAAAIERLGEIGDWMKINGEAIYGTEPIAPYGCGTVRLTRKGTTAYAIVPAQDESGAPPRQVRIDGIAPAAGSKVTLLGSGAVIAWRAEGHGFVADLCGLAAPCPHAWTLRFAIA